jgi:hypothetical protein
MTDTQEPLPFCMRASIEFVIKLMRGRFICLIINSLFARDAQGYISGSLLV